MRISLAKCFQLPIHTSNINGTVYSLKLELGQGSIANRNLAASIVREQPILVSHSLAATPAVAVAYRKHCLATEGARAVLAQGALDIAACHAIDNLLPPTVVIDLRPRPLDRRLSRGSLDNDRLDDGRRRRLRKRRLAISCSPSAAPTAPAAAAAAAALLRRHPARGRSIAEGRRWRHRARNNRVPCVTSVEEEANDIFLAGCER